MKARDEDDSGPVKRKAAFDPTGVWLVSPKLLITIIAAVAAAAGFYYLQVHAPIKANAAAASALRESVHTDHVKLQEVEADVRDTKAAVGRIERRINVRLRLVCEPGPRGTTRCVAPDEDE